MGRRGRPAANLEQSAPLAYHSITMVPKMQYGAYLPDMSTPELAGWDPH